MPIERQFIFGNPAKTFQTSPSIRSQGNIEVIPDSEEERLEQEDNEGAKYVASQRVEVIEISSDDSEDDMLVTLSPTKPSTLLPATPKRTGLPRPHYSRTRVIESDDDDFEREIIEISDSSVEITEVNTLPRKTPVARRVEFPQGVGGVTVDESIIIFDEPRSARTPLRIAAKKSNSLHKTMISQMPNTFDDPTGLDSPSSIVGSSKSIGSARAAKNTTEGAPRRTTKRARQEAEQERRHEYAQQLFDDLNKLVFKQGLPENTKLNWNKRLLTTAGRAKYHRSREGVQTTEIEMADKILDCEERIRNTLSHEMCHLATWVIDQKLDEHHGKLFKYWASRVMKLRPDIHVSIKHDYEITYPFNWKCEKCAKIYGRFSKSIRPDECRCGACKEGVLIPLFKTRAQRSTPKLSKMAATKPQDSPQAARVTQPSVHDLTEGSDSEAEIDAITEILALTTIEKH